VKGESTQPVQVPPKEVSVRLGSYPGDGEGDRPVEAPGTEVAVRNVGYVLAGDRDDTTTRTEGRIRCRNQIAGT